MSSEEPLSSNRRDFVTGKSLRTQIEQSAQSLAGDIRADDGTPCGPQSGSTIRLSTRAMACEVAVLLNPSPDLNIEAASAALELIHQLEDQMSVYRDTSELSLLNQKAAQTAVQVEPQLFELLQRCQELSIATSAAFDPTSGPLVDLWRRCREQSRIPNEEEIGAALARTGVGHLQFDKASRTVAFGQSGTELNLGGIGKGYALDRAGRVMSGRGMTDWLLHGGRSSILARGDHSGRGGWPVGIRNPLFPGQRLATILLKDCGFSTSGSGVQHFRHGGKRYGHIIDPRSGWPVEGILSVSVIAATAAEADALSTAFFVLGVENARTYCDNHDDVSALLIPPPRRGRTLEPVVCGISDEVLFMTPQPT